MTQKELTDLLSEASELYYQGKESALTDTEFDLKLHELMEMEKQSGVVYLNSPTLRVGNDIQTEFKKLSHPYPMLTINNCYDDGALGEWLKKAEAKYNSGEYNISVKYDGISCEIRYRNGRYFSASTRGDKNVGDDITENVRTIKDVPMYIESLSDVDSFYVRGEVLLPISRLARINEERTAAGEMPFRNTRNACSGSLKQLDARITASRGLTFRAWDCFYDDSGNFIPTMREKVAFLKDNGFAYEEHAEPFNCQADKLIETVTSFKKTIDALSLDYDYDGVVIKIDDCKLQNEIGTKDSRAIEWGIARKWNEEYIVQTELLDVSWGVGRTGTLTPVGKLQSVECGGVTITYVTLNNTDFIRSLGIRLGNTLKITRSGGVIPYVLGSAENPLKAGRDIEIPSNCPVCGMPLSTEGKLLKCVNGNCPARSEGKVIQFCSKDCMDIRNIGEQVVRDLFEARLIENCWDLYALEEQGMLKILFSLGEGYGESSVRNILDGIEKSKEKPFDKVLASISIPGVGKTVARVLANFYKDIDTLYQTTPEELNGIDGIGEIMSKDIYGWLNSPEGKQAYEAIHKYGLSDRISEQSPEEGAAPLAGMTLCFTGKSLRFNGDEVEDYLESKGAKCTHSVSKSMDYLITGDKPGGSKLEKAGAFGVPVIAEKEFYDKFGI